MTAEGGGAGVWHAILGNLKDHAEASLCIGILFSAAILFAAGASIWLAAGLPIVIYLAYLTRMTFREKHVERMADKDIERLERVEGQRVLAKSRRAIERRRAKGKS